MTPQWHLWSCMYLFNCSHIAVTFTRFDTNVMPLRTSLRSLLLILYNRYYEHARKIKLWGEIGAECSVTKWCKVIFKRHANLVNKSLLRTKKLWMHDVYKWTLGFWRSSRKYSNQADELLCESRLDTVGIVYGTYRPWRWQCKGRMNPGSPLIYVYTYLHEMLFVTQQFVTVATVRLSEVMFEKFWEINFTG